MRTLDQQIERISEVTGIIGEIADETNLLALNATIEAAGAREYGRRFAAVAEEVQRLARRATSAVEQIQDMVLEINQASNAALLATSQGLHEAQVGDRLVGSLSAAVEDVGYLVTQTSTLANNIAEATSQQRAASAQIVEVMQKITVTSDRLTAVSGEINRVVGSLEGASIRLTQTEVQFNAPPQTLPAESLSPTWAQQSGNLQPVSFSFEPLPAKKVKLPRKAKSGKLRK
jgi:methyl-accepting chemotaxis protein